MFALIQELQDLQDLWVRSIEFLDVIIRIIIHVHTMYINVRIYIPRQ